MACEYKINIDGEDHVLSEHEFKGYLLSEGVSRFVNDGVLDLENVPDSIHVNKTIAQKGKMLADRIRSLKTKKDIAKADIFGIGTSLYDTSIDIIAYAVEHGAKLADAISRGVEYIKTNYGKNLNEDEYRKHVEEGSKLKLKTKEDVTNYLNEVNEAYNTKYPDRKRWRFTDFNAAVDYSDLTEEETREAIKKSNIHYDDKNKIYKHISDKGKRIAQRIRELKSPRDRAQANIFGIAVGIYDGALEAIATAIEQGARLADAISDGIRYIRENGGEKFDEQGFRQHLEDQMEGKKPKIRVTVGEDENIGGPPVGNNEETVDYEENQPQRSFSKRVLQDENISEEAKKEIEKKIRYARQTNAMTIEEANDIINHVGEERAYDLVVNDRNMKPAVRVTIGQILIKKFNDLAANAVNNEDKDYYIDKTVDTANYVSEKLGTEAGQMIQAFSLFDRLTPEGQLRNATKQQQEIGEKQRKKAKRDVNNLGNKLKEANREAADEVSEKIKPAIEKTESEKQKKIKSKIEKAREKRDKIRKKRKDDKGGKPLFSSIGGLTPEGIEYVGNLAATYIEEGVARLELIVDNIINDLKNDSGKEPTEKVIDHIHEIVGSKLYDVQNKIIAQSIKKIESQVGKALKKYGLVPDEVKNEMIDDVVKKSGLSGEEAVDFRKEVQDEIENIIKRREKIEKTPTEEERIAKGIKGLESEIGKIIKEHYTVNNETKKSLIDKFVDEAGLSKEEAADLAKEIQSEFDNIASRKKRNILEKEKEKFEKVKSKLKGGKTNSAASVIDDVIKFTNLGGFDNDDFLEMLADKLGTGKLSPEQGKKITELAEAIQKAPAGNPKNDATQNLLAYVANLNGNNWGEIFQAVWYANVLSGPFTHIKNIVSTFFNGMAFAASEVARDPKSLPVILVGGLKGAKRGFAEAWHTVATGRSPIHIKSVETPSVLERKTFLGGWWNPYNYLKFVGRLMAAEDVIQFQALKEMRATQLAYREAKKMGLKNPFSKEVWNIINEKLLNTKERYEEANSQAESEGLTGKEKDRRIYEIMEESRPIQMTEDAYGFAAKGTFNHESEGTLGALTNAVAGVLDFPIGNVRPLRFVVPFTRIITNVVNNWLDFSPIGFVRAARGKRGFESFEGSRYGKNAYRELTSEERKQIVTRASLGIALTMGLYALTKIKGDDDEPIIEITGGGTGDYKKDIQLKQEGWQPYSIKVGKRYYSYALTPLMFNLGIIGNISDHEKYTDSDQESILDKTTLAIYQSGKMISDGTWIGTTSSLMGSLASDNPAAMEKGISSTLGNAAKGLIVPNGYTQTAQETQRIFDLPQKDAHSFLERLIQDVPIARNSLNNKINALGDPIVRDTDIMVSKETDDPVWKFIMDKGIWIAPVNKNSIIVLDRNTKKERPITDDEYYKFSQIRGQQIKIALTNIMEVKPNITTEQLEKVMKKIKSAAGKRAKRVISLDIEEGEE